MTAPSVSQLLAEITLENQALRRERDEAVEAARKAYRFIGGITADQWAAIDKLIDAQDASAAVERVVT